MCAPEKGTYKFLFIFFVNVLIIQQTNVPTVQTKNFLFWLCFGMHFLLLFHGLVNNMIPMLGKIKVPNVVPIPNIFF